METLILKSPYDMHIHFREGDMLELVAPLSAEYFGGGVIMPNLVPPVDSLDRLENYTKEINTSIQEYNFEPFMTLFFKEYDEEFLQKVKDKIIGIKLYPAGATTNSDEGIEEIKAAKQTFKLMEEMGIPLLVHGESNGFVLDRESEFLKTYRYLAETFPDLMIVMEHITTKDAVHLLGEFENLYATITLQHLCITLDDVIGGLMQPHHFCKPIAKKPEDREALLETALETHRKVSFGSDSAPHPIEKKEAAYCSAGCFTAPFALQYLAEIFDKHDKLNNLQRFISDNAVVNYKLKESSKTVVLKKDEFIIPNSYGNVVPFNAGKSLNWKIEEVN